jgi:lipopolysaccharide/colanic/teichoic acid biosynthesis glycosyltransferase
MYQKVVKRLFDILFSFVWIIILLPVLVVVAIIIKLDSKGPILYFQKRVAKGNKDFYIYKFRTMRVDADKLGLLTASNRDPRVTKAGYWLRKFKIDELPQFFNILKGDMSFVGPRAEVRRYVDFYSPEQMKVLDVKPGLTDYAVLEYYSKEGEILKNHPNDFEEVYINLIMVEKNKLNLKYIDEMGFMTDMKIIFRTVLKIFGR